MHTVNLEALPFADRCIEELRAYMEERGLLQQDPRGMKVEQAKQRLLSLLDERGGSLQAADVEADAELARNQEVVSAAAHELATENDIYPGNETGDREWFPFSFLMRKP